MRRLQTNLHMNWWIWRALPDVPSIQGTWSNTDRPRRRQIQLWRIFINLGTLAGNCSLWSLYNFIWVSNSFSRLIGAVQPGSNLTLSETWVWTRLSISFTSWDWGKDDDSLSSEGLRRSMPDLGLEGVDDSFFRGQIDAGRRLKTSSMVSA